MAVDSLTQFEIGELLAQLGDRGVILALARHDRGGRPHFPEVVSAYLGKRREWKPS